MLVDILKLALGAVVLWFAVVWLSRFLSWVERSEIARQKAEAESRKAAPPASPYAAAPAIVTPEREGVPAHHIVVIAAAVAAYGYKVVHIADAGAGRAWASEGRWQHQTSHRRH
jgi:hypothetical protein